MKKNEKRTYLHPQTEVVRFNVNDIITTSGETGPNHGGSIVGNENTNTYGAPIEPDPYL